MTHRGILKWLEKFAYRHADHIVPVTDAFEKHIREITHPGTRITVIKNGANLSLYDSNVTDGGLRKALNLEGKTVAAYFGTHGMAHHLETILESAEQLKDNPNIVFLTIGDGAERQKLIEKKEAMGLDNVMILGQKPKEEMPRYWAMSDIALVLLRKTDLFKTVIPSKIFEAMAMRKPIILGVEGESKAIIEAANAGVAITPENATELTEAVLRMCDATITSNYGESGEKYVSEFFDRKKLAARYLDVLQETVNS